MSTHRREDHPLSGTFGDTRIWSALSAAERRSALARPAVSRRGELTQKVREIVEEVRRGGDRALINLTESLDGVRSDGLEVSPAEKRQACETVSREARVAMERAAGQIERFHSACAPSPVTLEVSPGMICRRVPLPVERVGLYIPGGTAPLPSTVLMLGVPARLAGCPTRILCSPPRKTDGNLDPHIIAAAEIVGIPRLFKVGGAQAVAAMAYGTESVPKVDKIFGPGNAWVTEAKSLVASDPDGASIDMPAGPSEVLVVADLSADPAFVAADLLSQAEHGPDSQVILVSDSSRLIAGTRRELETQLERLPRKAIAAAAAAHSRFFLVDNLEIAFELSNAYAPEHLILQVEDPGRWAKRVRAAGSVFLGHWSPEAVGDYASGTNHVLPTYGYARAFSGVSVESFLKQVTFQELTPRALAQIAPTVECLARLEGLEAHARAVALRRETIQRKNR